jgi:hypothetical protein
VKKDAPPERIAAMIEWFAIRQKAVDDARSEVPYSKCRVYTYAEVNRVRDAMKEGRQRMVNAVLPKIPVDFVSYSAYDCQMLPAEEVRATLDYVNAQLPPKAGLPEKRVFIGECGLSWKACGGDDGVAHEKRNREILVKFLSWKPAMVLFWQYYNNEVVDGEQVGFLARGPEEQQDAPARDAHRALRRPRIGGLARAASRIPSLSAFRDGGLQRDWLTAAVPADQFSRLSRRGQSGD